jgi:hypothetical protein
MSGKGIVFFQIKKYDIIGEWLHRYAITPLRLYNAD